MKVDIGIRGWEGGVVRVVEGGGGGWWLRLGREKGEGVFGVGERDRGVIW